MYLQPNQIEELKSEVTIHRILNLSNRTTRINCVLPGHTNDTSRDMYVDPTGHYFYCHKCKQGGDVIKLIQLTKNLSRGAAIDYIVTNYSLRNFELDSEELRERDKILTEVLRFYQDCFNNSMEAKEYVSSRGWSVELFSQFGGYDSGEPLSKIFNVNILLKHGLVTNYGSLRNTLERRIIFPQYNTSGYLVQLLGRSIDPTCSMKLIPLPCKDKQVFKFSNYLFNEPILSENPNYIFICEGQSDTYTLMELGVNAVGLSGNSNLYKHAYKFRHIPNIAILLDSDEPSQKRLPGETLQLLYKLKALKSSSRVFIIDLPKLDGVKDVNDIKVKFGLTKKEVSKFKRTPAIEYLMSIYAKDLDSHINLLPLLDDTNLLKFSELSGISVEALQYARRIASPIR